MFARHVGTKSAILLKRVRRLFTCAAAVPTKLHGRQGSYLDRFHDSVPLVDNVHGLVYSRRRGHAQAQPTMALVHYLVLRNSVSAGSASDPQKLRASDMACDVATELKRRQWRHIETAARGVGDSLGISTLAVG